MDADLQRVLIESWPVVTVLLILGVKALRGITRYEYALLSHAETARRLHETLDHLARVRQETQEVDRLRREIAWLRVQLAHEGPGAGYRKAAQTPPMQGANVAPAKPGCGTRKD